jgi:hypothetical protein
VRQRRSTPRPTRAAAKERTTTEVGEPPTFVTKTSSPSVLLAWKGLVVGKFVEPV